MTSETPPPFRSPSDDRTILESVKSKQKLLVVLFSGDRRSASKESERRVCQRVCLVSLVESFLEGSDY